MPPARRAATERRRRSAALAGGAPSFNLATVGLAALDHEIQLIKSGDTNPVFCRYSSKALTRYCQHDIPRSSFF